MDTHGQVQVDDRQLLPGRGAYVCKGPECIKRLKDKHLHNAWRKCNFSGLQSCSVQSRLHKSFGKTEVRV